MQKRKKMKPVTAHVLVDNDGNIHEAQVWGDAVFAAWPKAADARGWIEPIANGWRVVRVRITEAPKKHRR